MKRITGTSIVCIFWACSVLARPAGAAEPEPAARAALEAIQKLGGKIIKDANGAVVEIQLTGGQAQDDDLKWVAVFEDLQRLRLWGAGITDAGLAHLVRLKSLKLLVLENADITDAGLAKLKAFPRLKVLNLRRCSNVTDAGLAHLKPLGHLEQLHPSSSR